MKIRTKVEFESNSSYDNFTCLVTFSDIESRDSLTEFLVERDYEPEYCSGDEEFESFTSDKGMWDNKAEFMKEIRSDIKEWKKIHRK